MVEQIKESKVVKKEIDVIVTPQAQMVLANSKYTIEDFVNWQLSKISLGGNNVALFLEDMYKQEANQEEGNNDSSTS